ncbi:MAG: carboxypeptidase-like regulatory domain-containing protein, partial [Tannerellaceae bacterium]
MKSNSMPKLMLLASVLSTSGAYAFAESKPTVSESFVKERTATIENLIVSQKQKITGTILDQAGEPMIGVNVIIKGSSTGTITDLDGNFTLDANPGQMLEISYIGYKPITIQATKQTMKIKMQEDLQNLDEVVVVGYGVTKKANLTGSVSSIKAEALQSRPVSSVSAALAGQMPGVTSIQRSGAPGGQAGSITIRGKNSINAASPLVIVDGVPGSMDTIDPNDI